ITVAGLSKVIEADLRRRRLSYSDYTIRLTAGGKDLSRTLTIIHCPKAMPMTAEKFLRENFLIPPCPDITDPAAQTPIELPEGFSWPIEVIAHLTEAEYFTATTYTADSTNTADSTTTADSETYTEFLPQGWQGEYLYTQSSTGSTAGEGPADAPLRAGMPKVIHTQCGQREAHYIIGAPTDEWTPQRTGKGRSLLFRFRNLFNCPDYIWLHGTLETTPTSTSQTIAIAGTLRKVDLRTETEYTLTAHGLTKGQALRAAQLLDSHDVQLLLTHDPVTDGQQKTDIIITEVTGPVTDSPTDLNTIKIKFKPTKS
ncbi:MAG: hypothetical protein NC039_09095, partial [Muribaculaceae bacterium]|nr:hypothetical protein [Muribaculaceae bacterium]